MKDELSYSANHCYREGYDDGYRTGRSDLAKKGLNLLKVQIKTDTNGREYLRPEDLRDLLERYVEEEEFKCQTESCI